MKDTEIKKALEEAINEYAAEDVASPKYFKLIIAILDLFNRQRAEIERLQKENNQFADIGKMYSEIKAEAIKEFAERLKVKYRHYTTSITSLVTLFDNINNLVSEMVGEG